MKELTKLERALYSFQSNETFADYQLVLQLHEFPHGYILDLGAAEADGISRYMAENHPETKIVSVNPHLSKKITRLATIEGVSYTNYAEEDMSEVPYQQRAAAAIAQELPFKKNLFKEVWSHAAIPVYLKEADEEYFLSLSEIARVLKVGGVARLGPCLPSHAERVCRVVVEHNIPVSVEVIPRPDLKTTRDWGETLQVIRLTKKRASRKKV